MTLSAPKKRKATDDGGPHKSKRSSSTKPSAPSLPPTEPESSRSSPPHFREQPTTSEDGPSSTFSSLGIVPELLDTLAKLSFHSPTPIQSESIPHFLSGRDLIGLAETGSGKTAAFALPILQSLLSKPSPFFALVLAPTRELAYQTSQAFEALGSEIGVKSAVLVGGMDMMSQSIALGKRPHIIVATPGRLLDHLENTKGFSLRDLKYLVLDEADRLLDLDFGPSIDKILRTLPKERQTSLFSATMTSKVESLQRASLTNPVKVSVSSSSHQTVKTLLQSYLFVPHKHKDLYLVHLLNDSPSKSTIIFTRTVNETHRLALMLRALGFGAVPIHGQLSQSARLGALSKFRTKSRNILVATDVAARGLDIPSVDLVLNFDLPPDSETYIHRVGRTARAGKSGRAISIVTQYDVEVWLRIEGKLGRKVDEVGGVVKEEVMVLGQRVGEAQRVAVRDMKELHEKRGGRGAVLKGRRNGGLKVRKDDIDRDE